MKLKRFVDVFRKVLFFLEKVLENVTGLLLVAFSVFIVLQVTSRFVLKISVPWTEELSRYSFIWMVCLGAAVGVRKGLHFDVKMFIDFLPGTLRDIVNGLINLFILTLSLLIMIDARNFIETMRINMSPVLGMSMKYPYASVVVFGIFSSMFALANLIEYFLAFFLAREGKQYQTKGA